MRRITWAASLIAVGMLWGPAARPAAAQAAPGGADARLAAQRFYGKLVDEYLHSDWAEFDESMKEQAKHTPFLTTEQASDVTYMRQAGAEYRPSWWKYTRSSKNVSFTARIWGKSFKANYMPTGMLGVQMPVGIDERTGRFQIIVSWQPHMVDSTKPREDEYEKAHRLTEGDHSECTVWHELGHNYVSECLPAAQIMALYQNYHLLLESLQEFYADMTALYHCSPQGRKATLFIRTFELRWNDVDDPHTRAAHAIGSLLLSNILSDVTQWPSFRLPTEVPATDVERNAILYMYKHVDPGYTLAEDRALREFVGQYIRKQGGNVLRKKGQLDLPNGLQFKLLTSEDRVNQPPRDAWVKAQLEKAIASGQIKKTEGTKGHPRPFRINVAW